MTMMIFFSLPVTDLQASIAPCRLLGFDQNLQFSDDNCLMISCRQWSRV